MYPRFLLNGLLTLLLLASLLSPSEGQEPDAQSIEFDGGTFHVENQEPNSWRYFRIVVPEGVDGWDVRIADVEGGNAQLVIRRDELPDEYQGSSYFPDFANHPTEASSWPSGLHWAAGEIDWTGRGMDAQDTDYPQRSRYRIVMAMGRPLEAGTYYAGVYTFDNIPSDYTFISRGVGTDQWYDVQQIPLESGRDFHIQDLPPREAAYFKMTVPENTPSWEFTLSPTEGEMLMAVGYGTVPDFTAKNDEALHGSEYSRSPQVKLQKVGQERFVMLPLSDSNGFLETGDYYIAAIAEGGGPTDERNGVGNSSSVLSSLGPLTVEHLGTVSPTGITTNLRMEAGQLKAFQFDVPAGHVPCEALLGNSIGTFRMSLVPGVRIPLPDGFRFGYGYSGGFSHIDLHYGNYQVIFTNTRAATYSLVVRCAPSDAIITQQPTVDLTISLKPYTTVEFNNGTTRIENQLPDTWKFFQVTVPDDVMGWDIRLTEHSEHIPYLMVRRDVWPESPTSTHFPWLVQTSPVEIIGWPSGNQMLFDRMADWTGKYMNFDGSTPPQHVILTTGQPLNPGVYCLGVLNPFEVPISYTLESRGIGDNLAYPIQDLEYTPNSSADIMDLPVREAEFFKITIPPGTPNCEFELKQTQGELLMVSRYAAIPDLVSNDDLRPGGAPNTYHRFTLQRRTSRVGSERYVMFPYEEEEFLRAGNYYFAIVSEGLNPEENRTGTGTSSGTFTCLGPLAVTPMGPITTSGVKRHLEFVPGQIQAFQIQVPNNISNLEIRLDNRVGELELSLSKGTVLPFPHQDHWYGSEGGWNSTATRDNSFISLPDPDPGIYSLVIRSDESTSSGVSADLTVRNRGAIPLNFSATQNANGFLHTDTRHLVDGQTLYYEVEIPVTQAGEEVLGWILRLSHEHGSTVTRIRREDAISIPDFISVNTPLSVIVPPFITPGLRLIIEVRAIGATLYTLSSEPVSLEQEPWTMPEGHNVTFGDSGDGSPHEDESLLVGRNEWHFFAIDVPVDGASLLRTELEAMEGNPRLVIREDGVPTTDYAGGFDILYHRDQMAGIGNWVPVDQTVEPHLRPGRWYLGVTAWGGDARYRLRVSNGNVVDVTDVAHLHQYASEERSITQNDWTYYRFTLPWDAPTEWYLDFFNPSGDASMYLRNGVPPGNRTRTDIHESPAGKMVSDEGRHTFRTPKLRPGNSYYVGFSAATDAVFHFESSTSGDTIGYSNIPVLSFGNGVIDEVLAPGASRLFRIPVPLDSNRVTWESFHSANVKLSLEQGTLPGYDGDHGPSYVSFSADSVFYENTYLGVVDGRSAWPWVPGQDYYLEIVNNSTVPEPIQLTMAGDNLSNHAPFIVPRFVPLTIQEDEFTKSFFISSDEDGDALTHTIVDPPKHGTATLGTMSFTYDYVTYTPDPNFFGTDHFSFKANDGELDSNIETYTVIVTNIPDDPFFEPIPNITIAEDIGYRGTLSATDVDGDALIYRMVRKPRFGHANVYADGGFVYQPNANYHGTDDFTVIANDGTTDSNLATVNIIISPTNDLPVIARVSPKTVEQGGVLTGTFATTDADGDAITYVIASAPGNGTLFVSNSGLYTYTPSPGFHGPASFSVKASDGIGESNVVVVEVEVTPGESAIEVWKKEYFGDSQDENVISDLADPDADGLMNLIEFAFGLHPMVGDIDLLPEWTWTGNGLEMRFTSAAGVSDVVSFAAEWSTDPLLQSWQTAEDEGDGVTHSFAIPKGDERKIIARIRVMRR